ncbi:hypothetical protein NDU88_002820 [Pleurodeles waltl]|uniref:Uncharacterized protein n=1 Tax=Pleurodeles waltl TaxID=8319 RepID=A0AAV7WQL5_PLEWA|nr:hypothetical protein NDU88_002820 [Pleurodeles waltl]
MALDTPTGSGGRRVDARRPRPVLVGPRRAERGRSGADRAVPEGVARPCGEAERRREEARRRIGSGGATTWLRGPCLAPWGGANPVDRSPQTRAAATVKTVSRSLVQRGWGPIAGARGPLWGPGWSAWARQELILRNQIEGVALKKKCDLGEPWGPGAI